MTNKFLIGLWLCVGVTGPLPLFGQSTASPYTLFGIGEIDPGNYGEYSGMAGLGIGIRQLNTLNTANPAAVSAIRSQTFVFDGSFYGKTAWYSGQGKKEYAGSGNIRRLAVGFRATDRWAISVGMTPFSSVGYDIRKSTPIEGSPATVTSAFTGEGGFSKVYVAQAFSITPKLSAGIHSSVVFGTITHTETSDYWTSVQKSRGERLYFDFGVQYSDHLNRNLFFTLGLIAGYQADIAMHNTIYSYDYEGAVAKDEPLPSSQQSIPEFYGGGISFSSRRVTAGADYLFQRWSAIRSSSGTVRYKDMNKLTVGASYTPELYSTRQYWRLIRYQLGASVNDSYLAVSGKSGYDYTLTGGAVFPMRNTNSLYLGIEYGKKDFPIESRSSIRENYLKLTLGFSFKEAWFVKIKYD